jgi:hypothetical protein
MQQLPRKDLTASGAPLLRGDHYTPPVDPSTRNAADLTWLMGAARTIIDSKLGDQTPGPLQQAAKRRS